MERCCSQNTVFVSFRMDLSKTVDPDPGAAMEYDCMSSVLSVVLQHLTRFVDNYLEPVEPRQVKLNTLYKGGVMGQMSSNFSTGRIELLHVQLKHALLDEVVAPFSLGFKWALG